MIELTQQPIDFSSLTESVRSHKAGAVVLFLGTVREFTGVARTSWLEYEAFPEMAIRTPRKKTRRTEGPAVGFDADISDFRTIKGVGSSDERCRYREGISLTV